MTYPLILLHRELSRVEAERKKLMIDISDCIPAYYGYISMERELVDFDQKIKEMYEAISLLEKTI